MANTATRAEKTDSRTITFKNKEHENFYRKYLPQCRYQDVYHKVLFTNDYFKGLSSDAKVLYGLMLDRMALSVRNHWIDAQNRVYIIFTLEQVMEYMNCGKDKGVKILAELDTEKGIGLIERVKRGLGKPTIIYVKSFLVKEDPVSHKAEPDVLPPDSGSESSENERHNQD